MPNGTDGQSPLAIVATTAEVLGHPDASRQLLNPIERERADRFRRESTRRDFIAAHILVRLCAARQLGLRPAELALEQVCPGCGLSGHGRPVLTDRPGFWLSLSHTAGVVAAAAGWAPVGVDVEVLDRPQPDPALLARVLTDAEQAQVAGHPDPSYAFLRQWVRKEAMVKIGRADLDTLASLDLSALPPGRPGGPADAVHTFGDLHVLDRDDRLRGALAAVVSTVPVVVGTA
ncbi:4'-phosphopantetheinyl transferase superfamily protein [Kitasatospora sp. NPDC048540]|uniref:4'-phosphopantetheinyl transferase family protein n=1 Tax=unclassified Kitasatospora TaxID=2633591 RepID=UPI00053A9C5C|nr:4'-phosphopantetheinyl transferase superfamily protein [Kitasatospora sp. MBT63]